MKMHSLRYREEKHTEGERAEVSERKLWRQ